MLELFVKNYLVEMIAKNRSIRRDWREFESAATYLYAHSEATTLRNTSE